MFKSNPDVPVLHFALLLAHTFNWMFIYNIIDTLNKHKKEGAVFLKSLWCFPGVKHMVWYVVLWMCIYVWVCPSWPSIWLFLWRCFASWYLLALFHISILDWDASLFSFSLGDLPLQL